MGDVASQSPRADGVRNRERLVEVAGTAFRQALSRVTLEAIAKQAGVGIGTLYRHFPTRDALVEAVYRDELRRLVARAVDLAVDDRASVALRSWMSAYVDFVAAKREMTGELAGLLAAGSVTSSTTRATLAEAVAPLLEAGSGRGDGSLREDVPADDVVAAMAGVVLANDIAGDRNRVERLLDLLLDGLTRPSSSVVLDGEVPLAEDGAPVG